MPVIDDIGSGASGGFGRYGISGEPVVADSLRAGADVVLFSGDKLLGGPQCGIILGRKELIKQIVQHPLTRALRVDKLTLAALLETLRLHQDREAAERSLPLLSLLSTSAANLQQRAQRLAPQLAACPAIKSAEAVESQGLPGRRQRPVAELARLGRGASSGSREHGRTGPVACGPERRRCLAASTRIGCCWICEPCSRERICGSWKPCSKFRPVRPETQVGRTGQQQEKRDHG